MSAFDLVRSPELILKKIQLKLEKSKTVCLDCSDYVTFKFTPKYWSFKCKCGIHLFYPPRHDRAFAYGHKFISSDDYDKTKRPRWFFNKMGKDFRQIPQMVYEKPKNHV